MRNRAKRKRPTRTAMPNQIFHSSHASCVPKKDQSSTQCPRRAVLGVSGMGEGAISAPCPADDAEFQSHSQHPHLQCRTMKYLPLPYLYAVCSVIFVKHTPLTYSYHQSSKSSQPFNMFPIKVITTDARSTIVDTIHMIHVLAFTLQRFALTPVPCCTARQLSPSETPDEA